MLPFAPVNRPCPHVIVTSLTAALHSLLPRSRVADLFHSVQLNVNNPHFLIMQGRIPALNLVEGSYLVDAFVATKNTRRDVTELMALHVQPSLTIRGIQPYSARDRGYVELPFTWRIPMADTVKPPAELP